MKQSRLFKRDIPVVIGLVVMLSGATSLIAMKAMGYAAGKPIQSEQRLSMQ